MSNLRVDELESLATGRTIPVDKLDTGVREDLANPVKGAAMVAYEGGTVADKLDEIVSGAVTEPLVDAKVVTHNEDANSHPELRTRIVSEVSSHVTAEADRAEVARDAAEDAVQYDYLTDTNTTLNAITGMVSGQTAFVRATEVRYKYSGSAWFSEGLSPTAAKMDKAGPRQGVLYAMAASIAVNTAAKTITISGRVRSGERSILLSNAVLDYSALAASGQVLADLGSGAVSVVGQPNGVVTAGKAAIFQINPETGILTGTLDGYTLNGVPMTGLSGLRRGSLGYGVASSLAVNTSAKTITFASGLRVLTDGGMLTTSSQILSYSSLIDLRYLLYGPDGFYFSTGEGLASVTEERILIGSFDTATGYFAYLPTPYTVNGVEIGPRGGLRYAMALTLPDRFNFDFNLGKLVVGEYNPVLVEGTRVMMTPGEVDLTTVNMDVWGVVLVDRSTGAVSVATTGGAYDRALLVVGGFRRDQKRVSGFDNYSINGVPNNQKEGEGRFANVTLGWDLPGVYTAPEMPSYQAGQPIFLSNLKSADVYAWYDDLVDDHSDYITKTHLGDDDTGLPIYEYRFSPLRPTVTNGSPDTVRVLMDAGIHPEPLSPIYLYHVMDQIANHWDSSPLLEALRFGVEFSIVPVVCPWALDNRSRRNSNGVDINRNFPVGWKHVPAPDVYSGGPYPLSEPETQYIYALMQDFKPQIYSNGHTFGTVATGRGVWCAVGNDHNGWFLDLGTSAGSRMLRKWVRDYSWVSNPETFVDVSGGFPVVGSATRAASSLGALSYDIEVNQRLPDVSDSTAGDPRALRIAVEWSINLLVMILRKHIR